jgi:hypothetical protein
VLRRYLASAALFLAVGVAVTFATCPSADAQSPSIAVRSGQTDRQMFEISAGMDTTAPGWSAYGGLVAALYGDVRQDGFRLRIGGGHGRYHYDQALTGAPAGASPIRIHGQQDWFEALAGYQWSAGPTTVKLYGGLIDARYREAPDTGAAGILDPATPLRDSKHGLRLALETWTRLSDWGFLQADLNWSQPFEIYGGRIRLGYVLDPAWSTGLEAAAFGNQSYDGGRVGAFARYTWDRGEISVSAGLDGDRDRLDSGYASVSALTRF